MGNAMQTMPAELAKALLEDSEKETKESFENVPSLVIATKEDESGKDDASIPLSDQPNGFMESVRDNPSMEDGISNLSNNATNNASINPSINPSNNPSNNPSINPSNTSTNNATINDATNTTPPHSPPSPLSDNSDLFF